MNITLNIIDYASFLVLLIAFLFLLHGWKHTFLRFDVKFSFALLLIFSTFHSLMNIWDWSSGINKLLDVLENDLAILHPILWGLFFYSFLQQIAEQELENREVKFQELFDEAPIGYHELDVEGRIARVNRTELEMLGYTSKEMMGHHVWDFIVESETARRAFMDKISGEAPPGHHFERTFQRKDGMLMPVLVEDRILKDQAGQITGIRSIIQDITDSKKTIEKLKESEEFSMALFEYNPIETIVVNTKGEIINFNLPKRKSGGRIPNVRDVMYKDYANKHKLDMYAELMQCISSGNSKTFPEQKYGNQFLSITIAPFPQGAIITSQDVTEQKLAEKEIKKLSSAVEQSNDGIVICDLEENLIYMNNAFAKMHGYSPEKMVGMKILDLHNDEQRDEVKKRLKQIKTKGEWGGELYHMRKDGTVFPTEMSVTLLKDEKGKPTGMLGICKDISAHKFVEEALQASEERYRELWNNAPVAYHTLDAKGIITSVNHTEAKMLGYKPEQMIGKPIFEFILPEQQREAKKRFLLKLDGKRLPEAGSRIYVARDGKKIPVSIDDILERDNKGKVTGVRTTMFDITEQKRAEEEREKSLQQVQKALGETINALVSAIETRDLYTAGHQRRVTQLASAIAEEMELPKNQIDAIRTAGLIHDIGKISIPAEILGKPAKLNNIEMDFIKTHPQVGYDILKSIEFPWPVANIVLQHHERMNGSGYPKGLSGKDILLEARILSVADVVEAMASYRPYREALGINKALEEISQNKGTLYDSGVVDVCLKLFKKKKFKLNKQ